MVNVPHLCQTLYQRKYPTKSNIPHIKGIAIQRLRQLRSKSAALPLKCLNIWFHFARRNILFEIFLIFTWFVLNEVGVAMVTHLQPAIQLSSTDVNVLSGVFP